MFRSIKLVCVLVEIEMSMNKSKIFTFVGKDSGSMYVMVVAWNKEFDSLTKQLKFEEVSLIFFYLDFKFKG